MVEKAGLKAWLSGSEKHIILSAQYLPIIPPHSQCTSTDQLLTQAFPHPFIQQILAEFQALNWIQKPQW